MPWKIVNLDYDTARPHLHIKDPGQPIHLRSYFDDRHVEIALGADEPDECCVRATVTPDDVVVRATRFEARHVQILSSILASLDIEQDERDEALRWMQEAADRGERDREGFMPGNVQSFPAPTGWPYDLADDGLIDSIKDSEGIPSTRFNALLREAKRRGLRVSAPRSTVDRAPRPVPGPEIFRRR